MYFTHAQHIHTHMHTQVYMWVHECVNAFLCAWVYMHACWSVYLCISMHMHINAFVCTWVRLHACWCVYLGKSKRMLVCEHKCICLWANLQNDYLSRCAYMCVRACVYVPVCVYMFSVCPWIYFSIVCTCECLHTRLRKSKYV